MNWVSRDPETKQSTAVEEPRTKQALSRIMVISIGRWILSGLDLPDGDASDGVSEVEAAMEF